MRRALVGTALTAMAVLALAQPANAAQMAPTGLGSPTITTDRAGDAVWASDPVSTSAGFKQKTWEIQFDASSLPEANELFASACTYYYDSNMALQKQTCTTGQISSGFTSTMDTAGLTHASVSASGIPAETCSYDANFQPIGRCKPAASMSVTATWTGQGPITYSTFTQFTPGVYRLISRTKSRNADASATFNGNSPAGQHEFAGFSYNITKEWGNPCGTASAQRGLTHTTNVPDGC
jgi:hypothetical protein